MRNRRKSPMIVFLISGIFILSSCNMPSNKTPTPDANQIITEAAVTVAAQLTLSAALTPKALATSTFLLTSTPAQPIASIVVPSPMPAVTNTPIPLSETSTSGDAASFVADVTVPDGTAANPGAVFVKTWRVKNTGTTTWSPAYSLVWIEGDKMGSPDTIPVPNEVRPGETVDISVNLTAPQKAGTFQTFFRLRNADGKYFRLDGSGDLWVKIIVGLTPTNTPGNETLTPGVTPATTTPTP